MSLSFFRSEKSSRYLFKWCSCRLTITRRVSLVEQELLSLPEHLSSPSVFSRVRVTRSLVLWVVFCRLLFVLLSFFFCSLCCLSFFDLQILITSLWYLQTLLMLERLGNEVLYITRYLKTGLTGNFTWNFLVYLLINFLSSPDFFVGSDGVPSY